MLLCIQMKETSYNKKDTFEISDAFPSNLVDKQKGGDIYDKKRTLFMSSYTNIIYRSIHTFI